MSVSPCQYNPDESFKKMTSDYSKSCLKMMPVSKNNDLRFVEIAAKKKTWVPPPGIYNITERVQEKIYKGPSPHYKRGI